MYKKMVFFDGGSNFQNAGKSLKAFNPCITVGHGAEHVVSLFFADVYTKVNIFHVTLCLHEDEEGTQHFWFREAPLIKEVQPSA